MENKKILNLIDEAYNSFKEIGENFYDSQLIDVCEKEEKFYKAKFEELGVDSKIVSEIYTEVKLSENKDGIESIKKNLEKRLIKN